MSGQDEVWKRDSVVRNFLDGVRGGIPFAAEQIEMMLRLIEARGEPVRQFADLGCGSGVLARAVRSRYPDARAVLVDFSEPMLAAARQQLGDQLPPPRLVGADLGSASWMRAIADEPPFDVVVSAYAIHHLPDRRKRELYAEIFHLLAPGGMFVNIEHVASHGGWVEAISDEMMVDWLYAFHQRRGAEKTRAQIRDEFLHRPDKAANILAPVETQCEWLRGCGFEDVDCYFKALELAVFGGRRGR